MARKDIPLAPLERILKKAGAKRVSKSALVAFSEVLEDFMLKVCKEAVMLAEHAGRKTLLERDVKLAKRNLNL